MFIPLLQQLPNPKSMLPFHNTTSRNFRAQKLSRTETLRTETFARINFRELITFAKVNTHDFFGKWSFAKVYARKSFENRD